MRMLKSLVPLLWCCSSLSHAALGAHPERFDGDAAEVPPSVSTTASNYVRRETTLKSGTRVREYISPAGIVFAVAWSGPVLPNLKRLLGKYFETMVEEVERVPKAGRSSVAVDRPEVVIRSGGRMRAFEGVAWIPAELPAGFSTDDLR